MLVGIGCKTSASNRNVAVSDQLRAETEMICPPFEERSDSIFVNGQGPAMHETRASLNSFPWPASRVVESIAAFHFPSGEQGCWFLHGTFPRFSTWKVFTALPIFTSLVVFTEYRTVTLLIAVGGRVSLVEVAVRGTICTT